MAVALVYFAYLAVAAAVSGAAPARRRLVLIVSLAAVAALLSAGLPHVVPLIYLLIGYWLPSLLVQTTNTKLEGRLLAIDRILFGPGGLDAFARGAPRPLLEYLELAYLFCYAMVPIAFGSLVLRGFEDKAAMFWSTVLLASFGCYGFLPWLATRAPRALQQAPVPARSSIRTLNLAVLERASVQWNTFPSGHTAASVAAALVVAKYSPLDGLFFGLIALSIAIGSVVGRYHYASDAFAGALVAIAAFVTASAVHGL